MNLRQLYYFRTIAELEHYTQAAEKLYVSQSNLSHAIQEMEEELNVKLFVRKGRNIKLTKYGELFLPYVQKTIETLESGISTLQEYINPNSGTVTMAAFPSMAQFVPDIIVRYLSETNRVGVRFQFVQDSFFPIQEQLLNGKVDLAFTTKIDDPKVECFHIGTHPLVLLVPLGHRLAREKSVSLKELDKYYALVKVTKDKAGNKYHFITNRCGMETFDEAQLKAMLEVMDMGGVRKDEKGSLSVHKAVEVEGTTGGASKVTEGSKKNEGVV